MRHLITLGLLLFVVFAEPAQARSYEDIIKSGYIEVAVYRDFPPYSYLHDGHAAGIDIELGKLIAKKLGVEPRWFWVTADENLEDDLRNAIWKGHVLDVEKKKADIMLRVPYDREFAYGMDGYGLPRNELVHMFGPYHQESWAIARDRAKTRDIRNLAIFQYQQIAVEIDSLPDTYLSATFAGRLQKNIVHFRTLDESVEAFKQGEVAAVAGIRTRLLWALADTEKPDVPSDGLEMLARKQWDIGIAVKQDYRELANEIDMAIEAWVKDGTLRSLFESYHGEYVAPSLYQ